MLSKLKRVFTPKSALDKQTIFQLFFSGQHEKVAYRYRNEVQHEWTNEELHYILASKSLLNEDVSDIALRLKKPLSPTEAEKLLNEQLIAEKTNESIGVLSQPKYVHKSLLAAIVGLQSGKTNFVETGTYTGQSLYLISGLFKSLSTVEASPVLYRAAKALFASTGTTNVTQHLGDTRDFLRSIDTSYGNNSIFFLDAHYSTGITSKEFGECPILDEIAIIFERAPNAILVIDDIRTMTGENGYPTLTTILNSLPSTMRVQFIFDQMILSPSERPIIPTFPSKSAR